MSSLKQYTKAKLHDLERATLEYAVICEDEDERYLDIYLKINHTDFMREWNEILAENGEYCEN